MPELIISDIMMPEMRETSCAPPLKTISKPRIIPIILLTALNDEKNIWKG